MVRTCDYVPIHGLWSVIWMGDQGLRRNMIVKLVTKEFEEELWR